MAHVFEGFQNGDALRVNDGFFRGDDDFGFHARAKKILRKNFRRSEKFLEIGGASVLASRAVSGCCLLKPDLISVFVSVFFPREMFVWIIHLLNSTPFPFRQLPLSMLSDYFDKKFPLARA
jgi:hypothetical protein